LVYVQNIIKTSLGSREEIMRTHWSLSLIFFLINGFHTHTHTYVYIYIYTTTGT